MESVFMFGKKRKIILAPPYSGTLYAYFEDCMNPAKMNHINTMGHPYYEKLFGMYTEQNKDVAIMLSILYDEIIIPPADARFPESGLGFKISWDKFIDFKQERKQEIERYIADPELSVLLQGQKAYEKQALLEELSYCVYLSLLLDCPIFCGKGSKKIIDRIKALNTESNETFDSEPNKITFLENYLTISSFIFDVTDLDIFEKIKYDSSIRKYSRKFTRILENKTESITTEAELRALIQESVNKSSIYQRIKGVCNISSLAFSVPGLIPILPPYIGVPASGISIASTGTEKFLSWKMPNWYELAPRIEMKSKMELLKKNL